MTSSWEVNAMKKTDIFVFAVLVLALPFIIRAVNKEGAKCQVKS